MTIGANGGLNPEHSTDGSTDVADPALGEESGDSATGNARVDEAVARLTELQSLPTSAHADVYEDVHRRLHTALTDLDSG